MIHPDPITIDFPPVPSFDLNARERPTMVSSRADAIANEIFAELLATGASVLSLDVFDSLLLRNNKSEAQRYIEISERIAQQLDRPVNWRDVLFARVSGMRFSYRTRPAVGGVREGQISDVFSYMLGMLELPITKDEFLRIELQYEAENLKSNPAINQLLRKVKDAGHTVILVSDMYLGAQPIAELVENVAGDVEIDHVFCSGDVGVSKRGGSFFPYLEQELSLPSDSFFHIGDSLRSDYLMPRKHGWHAMAFPVLRSEMVERHQSLCSAKKRLRDEGFTLTGWEQL